MPSNGHSTMTMLLFYLMDTSKQEIDIRAVVSWGAEGALGCYGTPGFENLTTSLDIVKGFHIIELELHT
jgi:hypothetical protein